ncbi:gfo/Idh/MocA family oxidoreductase, partial [Brevibacillus agri]|nr:gfo/Idh/MocA family oxidoreductase [Brevibacillus agri]
MGRVAVVGAKDAVDEQLGIWARVRGAKLVGRAESLQELHNLLAETKVEVVEFAGEADGAALAAAAQAGA